VLMQLNRVISLAWNFIFNANVSPLRHIQNPSMRVYVLQLLAYMWAIGATFAFGSYLLTSASLIGHAILIGCASVTATTYTAAWVRPSLFGAGRSRDGEHE
jgi:hypothetical protein